MKYVKNFSLVIFCAAASCVTYEASLQSGRSLRPGTSSHGLAVHYLVDHDRDVLPERVRANESINYGLASRHTGLSYHYRRGLRRGLDAAASLSFGTSSLGLGWNLVNLPRFALGVNPKLVVPTFSIDNVPAYRGGLLVPFSYDLLPDAALVLAPGIYRKVAGEDSHTTRALHSGLLLGRNRGVFLEWSFYQEHFDAGFFESKEQVKIGLLSNLSNFDRPPADWQPGILKNLRPSVGYEYSLLGRIGVVADLALPSGFPEEAWISWGLPYREQEIDESAVFWRSQFLGVRYRLPTGISEGIFYSLGLAHRRLLADIATDVGYQHRRVDVPMVSLGLLLQREQYLLRLLEVGIPLPFIYQHDVHQGVESHRGDDLGYRMVHGPSLLLVQLESGGGD